MIRPFFFIFLLAEMLSLRAGNTLQGLYELSEDKVSSSITYEGKFFQAYSWTDQLGENIFLLSIVPESPADAESAKKEQCALGCKQKQLAAYHFIRFDTGYIQYWKQRDGFADCPYTLYVLYDHGSPRVTDLDKDGLAETWYTYKLGCSDGENAYFYKLVMHEGQQKYLVKGTATLLRSNANIQEGTAKWDNSWNSLDDSIRAYAERIWKDYAIQDMRNPLADTPPRFSTSTVFPGISEKQLAALRELPYSIPAPTWLPAGYFLEKMTSDLQSDHPENSEIKLLFRRGNEAFVIAAGFDGLGSSDYAGGEDIVSDAARFTVYYEPIDNGDGLTLEGFATTSWFTVGDVDGPSWYVGSGTDAGSKYKLVPKDDIMRILASLKVIQ